MWSNGLKKLQTCIKNLNCLTQENYPGLSKKSKDKLPLAKSKTARSLSLSLSLLHLIYGETPV